MSRAVKGAGAPSQLRIIGGEWRGRKLSFTPADGLRPTTDRIRETLFNWLAPNIHGAHCLDLFAGSGALGLEALSRGAAHCDFVETSNTTRRQVRSHLEQLEVLDRGRCHGTPALQFLNQGHGPWDIAFIDPPFGENMVDPVCEILARPGALAAEALVYIETGSKEPPPTVPSNWGLHREKQAGGVSYRLFVVGPG